MSDAIYAPKSHFISELCSKRSIIKKILIELTWIWLNGIRLQLQQKFQLRKETSKLNDPF